eukprot:6204932-Pleurochrysis_carterae.AAC.1
MAIPFMASHIGRIIRGRVIRFDLYCLICTERQQYEYRFCPQPLMPYHGEGGTGMSNYCDSPTHIFDEHHPLAVPYMRYGLTGKENMTAAELYDHGAKGPELSRGRQEGGRLRSQIC